VGTIALGTPKQLIEPSLRIVEWGPLERSPQCGESGGETRNEQRFGGLLTASQIADSTLD
jgi:hypothetical protein